MGPISLGHPDQVVIDMNQIARPVVLIVDDGLANRELIEACLADIECEVRSAADGSNYASFEGVLIGPELVPSDLELPPCQLLAVLRLPSNGGCGQLKCRSRQDEIDNCPRQQFCIWRWAATARRHSPSAG